jgi:hypothetical protein
VALALGVAFALLTAVELAAGAWTVGQVEIVRRTTMLNLVHWLVALSALGSFFAGAGPSRIVARILGLALLGLGAWGFVSPNTLGSSFGFPGEIPALYNAYHGVAGVLALIAGFGPLRKAA